MGGLVAEILEEWRELERRLAAAEGDETKAIKARIVRVGVELGALPSRLRYCDLC
ncbi:MAG TPA: hypothetical protein VFP66_00525 [Candidatus Limnocylindrales bacterium]|nr:hypothetical protein [Candidatus Limnocylindrales bacterium]